MSEQSETKIVTLAELQEHTKKDNLYILINGKGSILVFVVSLEWYDLRFANHSLLRCKVY